MKVLGIDPGLARMGWAIIDIGPGQTLVAVSYGCLETPNIMNEEQRLVTLYDAVNKIILKYQPKLIALEQLVFASNKTTAFAVSQARGLVCLAAGKQHIPVKTLSPTQIKQTVTGYGRAEKKQVQLMVKTLYNLKQIPKPDDTADALAVAYTGGVLAHSKLELS